MAEYNAIEITAPRVAEIVRVMCSELQDADYDRDLHQNFVVFDYPTDGLITLITPDELKAAEATIEADGFKLKVLRITVE